MPALHTPLSTPARAGGQRVAKDASRARRRRALLQLARRHGHVRVAVKERGRVVRHAPDVLDLLDELNTAGLLTYGGLNHEGGAEAFIYRAT